MPSSENGADALGTPGEGIAATPQGMEKLHAQELEDPYSGTQKHMEKSGSVPVLHRAVAGADDEPSFRYMTWQFLTVFVSVSLGFCAALLGTLDSWSGGQTTIPISLLIPPLEEMLEALDLEQILGAANLTVIAEGLDMGRILIGVNVSHVVSSIDSDRILSGVLDGSVEEILTGLNVSGVMQGINETAAVAGVNMTQVQLGLDMEQLMAGLNADEFLSVAGQHFAAAVNAVKTGLWMYPTLLFTQVLSSLLGGRLSDYIGRRWVFLLGNIISFIGFICGGRANDASIIVGLTVLVGIGTGIQILGPWVILTELVPVRHRFLVAGLCVSLLAPLITCHTAIVNAFTTKTREGWHWAYYVCAILSFLSMIGLFAAYFPPSYSQLRSQRTEKPSTRGSLSFLALTVCTALATYVLGWGKLIYAWASPQVIVLIVVAGAGLVAVFVSVFIFGRDGDAYPAYLTRSYTHQSQMLLGSLNSLMLLFAPIVQLICFLTVTPRLGAQGAWEKTWGAGLAAGFLCGSVAMARPRHVKWHLAASTTVGMVFLAGLRGVDGATEYRTASALLFFTGLGHGYSTLVSYIAVGITADAADLGLAMGLASAFRSLAFMVARSVFLTVYINQVLGRGQRQLPEALFNAGPLPDTLTQIVDGLAAAQAAMSLDPLMAMPVAGVMLDALSDVLVHAWKFVVSLAYIYLFGSLLYSLAAPGTDGYLSDEIFVRLKGAGLVWAERRRRMAAWAA
ncbi:hypothetical protein BJY00DRAFT_313237 [Aspergillus carlsbadensis]|nr:hypothetical protein BJY00DRAFT_313237 [Aspergillus carlsbadensis]